MSGKLDPLEVSQRVLSGADAWIVGGAVRDMLLGREVLDYDIAVTADTRTVARAIAREADGFAFELSDQHGAWRVAAKDDCWQVDIVPLAEGDLTKDLSMRDFTINAMARPLAGGELVDPHGGREDLAASILRTVSERSFENDPLRTLRAVRIAVELGFTIEDDTAAAVREWAFALPTVAQERIFAELKRVLCCDAVREGLSLLNRLGLAEEVFPELLNGFDHKLEALEGVLKIEGGGELDDVLADGLSHLQALRFAPLFDCADAARVALKRWRSSTRLSDFVVTVISHYEAVASLNEATPNRALWRFLKVTHPFETETIVFALSQTGMAEDGQRVLAAASDYRVACGQDPLVRGGQLASELGEPPGPWLGKALDQLAEDRYVGVVSTFAEAVDRARALRAS